MLDLREKHEIFHENTSLQKKIINEKNFTYRIILGILNTLLIRHGKVLDIGCGAGTISLYIASKGYPVLGIDISQNAIIACKKSAKAIGLKNIRFQRITFPQSVPNEKFDYIICSEVLEHLKDDNLALKKIYLLLKNGGLAFISTPSKNAPLYRLGYAKNFDEKVGHIRRYTVENLIEQCKSLGFTIVATKKTEGVLRNFLFLNPIAGKLIRFIKFFQSDIITFFDEISLRLFGESQIIVIIQKP